MQAMCVFFTISCEARLHARRTRSSVAVSRKSTSPASKAYKRMGGGRGAFIIMHAKDVRTKPSRDRSRRFFADKAYGGGADAAVGMARQ